MQISNNTGQTNERNSESGGEKKEEDFLTNPGLKEDKHVQGESSRNKPHGQQQGQNEEHKAIEDTSEERLSEAE